MSPEKTHSEIYKVTSFLVNLRGQAGLTTILNFIQDVGFQHAFRMNVKLPENQGWVFTRQRLDMKRWPKWNDEVRLTTWLRPPKGVFLLRDYEIFVGSEKIGEATSSFSVMDMKLRKLATVDWDLYKNVWCEDHRLAHEPQKLQLSGEFKTLSSFEVRNSDIDLNRHVNNTKYSQWILDSLSLEILRGGVELKAYEVNFLSEAKPGDVVEIQQSNLNQDCNFAFQGMRAGDGKLLFTARLET